MMNDEKKRYPENGRPIKGLNLCERYFNQVGLPMILEEFSEISHRIAGGLVGDGSECFGFDDEISRDHDWGPGFCLWLTAPDYDAFGNLLAHKMALLPKAFGGFGPRIESEWGFGRIGVFEISAFYQKFIGMGTAPETLEEWLYLPENTLAACTNGKVFYDPLGDFSSFRKKLLEFYPEDVRIKKIASRCMTMAQFGQYNFTRCIRRNDFVAARYAETKFCADAVSLIYLLNKTYTPFFKWMHRGLLDLPKLGKWAHSNILRMTKSDRPQERADIIEDICRMVIVELNHQGLSSVRSTFLLDHGPAVQKSIKDETLRNKNVWIG